MGNGVEEFNPETAWSRFTAGFKDDQPSNYNKPPELRFTDGYTPNVAKIAGGAISAGQVMNPWVARNPNAKIK